MFDQEATSEFRHSGTAAAPSFDASPNDARPDARDACGRNLSWLPEPGRSAVIGTTVITAHCCEGRPFYRLSHAG
jgi:hypothetical protein